MVIQFLVLMLPPLCRFTISTLIYIIEYCKTQLCSLFHRKTKSSNKYVTPLLFMNNKGKVPHVIDMWYPCDRHVIPMWYSCDTHVILMWYPCDTHVIPIPMWNTVKHNSVGILYSKRVEALHFLHFFNTYLVITSSPLRYVSHCIVVPFCW